MPKTILIIEDEKFLRELIAKKLRDGGYGVLEAVDGEEGARMVTELKPDLILLDLILPRIDGFEVLAAIKSNPKTKTIPVIILSNLGRADDVARGLKLGAIDYLVKAHFTPSEIIEKIKAVLG